MSDGDPGSPQSEIERLTSQAVQAAERGDWDGVEACVERRGALLVAGALPAEARERVLAMDARLHELASQAKTAVGVLLMEAGQTRRKLLQLQPSRTGVEPGANPTMTIRV